MTDPGIGYADAMRELTEILDELERDDLDVDVLAERVKRASELHQPVPGAHRAGAGRRRRDRHRPRVLRRRRHRKCR